MNLALSVENLSKRYRLGLIGTGSASEDLRNWWMHTVLQRPLPKPLFEPLDHGNRQGDVLWALRDVSFSVKEGEVVGIIGKNGAGKSTLLKILSQITAPTAGQVRLNGRLASLLEVGTGFNGELTGRENIFLNGSILGMRPSEIRARFDEIVDFAEIDQFIDTPVKRYSSGMFVRLAFAVAAHLQTEIMVIDEILAVGDIGFQQKCLGKISDSSTAGRTVLFVSHRMDHISALCKRSLVLDRGQVVFDGATEQALGTYYRLFERSRPTQIGSRIDRKGRGRVRIVDAWVENDQGQRVDTVITGKRIYIKLLVKNMVGGVVGHLNAGVGIFSLSNMFVASLGSLEGGVRSFHVEDEALISIAIPRLPLNQGTFYANCSIRSASGAYEFDDLIENAFSLVVDYGDYHGIGQSAGGFMSIAQSTTISPCDHGDREPGDHSRPVRSGG